MFVGRTLKETKCEICKEPIKVIPFNEGTKKVVSHGECTWCGKRVVLPEEDFFSFCREHC